jgi:hypothetical protein
MPSDLRPGHAIVEAGCSWRMGTFSISKVTKYLRFLKIVIGFNVSTDESGREKSADFEGRTPPDKL